jgi:hypothetical protein
MAIGSAALEAALKGFQFFWGEGLVKPLEPVSRVGNGAIHQTAGTDCTCLPVLGTGPGALACLGYQVGPDGVSFQVT